MLRAVERGSWRRDSHDGESTGEADGSTQNAARAEGKGAAQTEGTMKANRQKR